MDCNSSTVAGEGVGAVAGNEPFMNRRKNSCKIKDILKYALGIVRKLLTGNDLVYHFPGGVFCRFLFNQFPIRSNVFLRFFGISSGREELIAAIIIPGAFPETVHKIKIGTERRQVRCRSTSDQCCKDTAPGESPDPGSKTELSRGLIEEKLLLIP